MYEAAHQAGVKRVIQISTLGIYRWSVRRVLNEESPQLNGARRQGGPYRATKQTSEALAWELSQRYQLATTALRPTAVYGARDYNFMRPVYKLLALPVLPMPSVSFPIVYAGDVAEAVVGALRNDASIGQAYNVGGENIQVAEFMKALREVVPSAPRVLALPLPVGVKIDNSKAARDIGFRNRPFVEALREVVAEDPPRRKRA